jgi:4-hydroxybenzoate polyprenyltransferase
MRLYSSLDLFVLATALTTNVKTIAGIVLIWISFLLFLEYRHKDELRLTIKKLAWLTPFVVAIFLLPIWSSIGFTVCAVLYAKKKEGKFWGVSAPFWRGLQVFSIVVAFNFPLSLLAFTLVFLRNLIGDFRDTGDDKRRNIITVPVFLGIKNNQTWAFYGHLLFTIVTTLVWFHYSFLNSSVIIPIIILQIISYPLTPRLSNPKYLDFYRE